MSPPNARATGFHDEMEAGADIMMKELRWPFFARGTYFAIWYNKFHPNGYTSFYGGVATAGEEKPPGMFMTYWGDLTNIHEGPYFQPHGYGAEGAKGGANGKAAFMRPNKWYRFVMRIYPSPDKNEKASYIGWWVKDVEGNRWYTHSVVRIPMRETGFTRNGGFVEELAARHHPREMDRRLGYYRLNGKWKPSHLSTNHVGRFKLAENDTIVHFQTPLEEDPPALKKETVLRTRQPDQPVLDKPAIEKAAATAYGKQVVVQWSIPVAASPQLRYKIEAFAVPKAGGKAIAVHEATGPQVLAKRLDCTARAKSVRLTVMGIFDQLTSVVVPVGTAVTPAKGERLTDLTGGLQYQYYEAPGKIEWKVLPDFASLKPARLGYVKFLDDSVRQERLAQYGLVYKGWIKVPATGLYVFELGTSDGSRMRVDGKTLADNDGIHGTSVGHYPACLEKGLHRLELDYFRGHKRPVAGGKTIVLRWEGPGFETRKVSKTDLFCKTEGKIPNLTLSVPAKQVDGVLADNLVVLEADIKTNGHTIDKVQFFYGDRLLGSKPVGGAGRVVLPMLLPHGKGTITARLWYNKNHSVNGHAVPVAAENQTEGPWKFADFGENKFPLGLRCKDGKVHFTGEGVRFGYQVIEGDFTLTARIAEVELATKENGYAGHNWIGLYVKHQDPEKRKSAYDMAGDYGVFLTTGRGVRGTPDFPDLGGGHMSINQLAARDHRWLRIIRRGKQYQSFASKDGKAWQKIADRVSERFRGKQAFVGFYFRSVPGKNRTFFNAALDRITLGPGAPALIQPVRPGAANLSLAKRITALVQSSDGKLVLARSTAGLFKSTDGGSTWAPLNGKLKGLDAMAVRSVAIHPKDASIILRAGGRVIHGKLVSGLWKSTDGGKSWRLTTREIDFDGYGPTTLFGEVIRFNPTNPDHVIAAGETKGLFVSSDGGDSWTYGSLKGERITCLDFSDQLQYKRNPLFVAGTFDDRQFDALGMAGPARAVKAPGRIYWCSFIGKKIRASKCFEMPEVGVTNIVFDAHQNFATATTTRGVYFTWMHGIAFSQRRYQLVADTLFVGLGTRHFSDWSRYTAAAPFSEPRQAPVFYSNQRGFRWRKLSYHGARLEGAPKGVALTDGITCILPDAKDAKVVYLCNRHGIFKSSDEGKTYRFVKGD